MNNQPKNLNSRLPEIGAILLVIAAVGYYFYSSNGSSATSSSFTVSSATTTVGANVLNLLNQIHSLRIDTSLFQSNTYQSLNDFSVIVPPENIGKADPFLPVGTAGNSLQSSSNAPTNVSGSAQSNPPAFSTSTPATSSAPVHNGPIGR
jgi:hypothetical protein